MVRVLNIGVGVWSLKGGFEVRILSLHLGLWSLGVGVLVRGWGFGIQGLGAWGGGSRV